MDKNDILSELYTLRAGLSLISLNKDKVVKLEKERENNKDELSNLKKESKNKEKSINDISKQLDLLNCKNSKELAENDYKKKYYDAKTMLAELKKNNFIVNTIDAIKDFGGFFIIAFIVFAVALGIGLFLIFDIKNNGSGSFWDKIQVFLGNASLVISCLALGSIILFVLFLFFKNVFFSIKGTRKKVRMKELKNNIKYLEQNHSIEVKRIEEEIRKIDISNRDKLDSKKQLLFSELKDLTEKKQKVDITIDEKSNYIKQYAYESKVTIKTLENTFSSLIDERDWENLDSVIYFIETGRADSIKEALQLVDSKKGVEEIKALIITASENIQNTISANTKRMASYLTSCFNHLENEIKQQGEIISEKIDGYNSKLTKLENKVYLSLSQGAINNALLAKLNETSKNLVEDSNYMRTLATNAEIRRRNNL